MRFIMNGLVNRGLDLKFEYTFNQLSKKSIKSLPLYFLVRKSSQLPSSSTKAASRIKKLGVALILGSLATGILCYNEDNRERLFQVSRIVRAFITGLRIFAIYKYVGYRNYKNEEDYNAELHSAHEKCSKHFLNMCLANKGLYIKMGQTVSALNHVLPSEWYQNLTPLRDKTLNQDFKYVEKLVKEDLGRPIEELFDSFDPKPIASASIAQVHQAITKDGEKVAVKVQFYYLQKQYPLDIKAIKFFCDALQYFSPSFSFGWMFKLVEEKLKMELNFKLEGENNERCKEMLMEIPNTYVPNVNWHLSGNRILTMEYIEGVNFNEFKTKSTNINESKDILERLIKVFAIQIFRHGYVHADPHSSNIFIRPNPSGSQDIVLLDHGLYEELDPDLRQKLAKLWIAGTTSDKRTLKCVADELNVDDFTILWEIFFQRPYIQNASGQIKLIAKLSPGDRKEMIKRVSVERFEHITRILQTLPREYLLVLRNLNLVRSLAQDYSEIIDRYYIIAQVAFNETNKYLNTSGYVGSMRARFSSIWFHYKYFTSKLKFKMIEIYIYIYLLFHGDSIPRVY